MPFEISIGLNNVLPAVWGSSKWEGVDNSSSSSWFYNCRGSFRSILARSSQVYLLVGATCRVLTIVLWSSWRCMPEQPNSRVDCLVYGRAWSIRLWLRLCDELMHGHCLLYSRTCLSTWFVFFIVVRAYRLVFLVAVAVRFCYVMLCYALWSTPAIQTEGQLHYTLTAWSLHRQHSRRNCTSSEYNTQCCYQCKELTNPWLQWCKLKIKHNTYRSFTWTIHSCHLEHLQPCGSE